MYPDCAWQWVTYICKDPCKDFTKQEAEAKAIMNGHVIEACLRTRKAIKAIKKYVVNEKTMKVLRTIHKVYTILRDILLTNPHHEDYRRIIR